MSDERFGRRLQAQIVEAARMSPSDHPEAPIILAGLKAAGAVLYNAFALSTTPFGTAEAITDDGLNMALVLGAWWFRLRLIQGEIGDDPEPGVDTEAGYSAQISFASALGLEDDTQAVLQELGESWHFELCDQFELRHGIRLPHYDPTLPFALDVALYAFWRDCFDPEFGRIYQPDEIASFPEPHEDHESKQQLRAAMAILSPLLLAFTAYFFAQIETSGNQDPWQPLLYSSPTSLLGEYDAWMRNQR